MANIKQTHIRIPFHTFLCWFLLGVFFVSIPGHLSNAFALDCLNYDLESYGAYRFIDPNSYIRLQKLQKSLCNLVENKKCEPNVAISFMESIVIRYGICRDNLINPDFESFLKNEMRAPDSVVLAHKHFCEVTYDPKGWDGIKVKGLGNQIQWLRVEMLCRWMHETANPTGFWIQLFKKDLPSQKKYEDRTSMICQELKSGNITYEDAVYLWQQEILEVQKRLGPETLKDMGESLKGLKDLIKPLLNLFKE